ncbi:MAG: hypothetical protein K2Y12_07150 [Chitinophagaceae bacterium]|jgi:hypothetical protein|nr:hypothetical protein [Chitinophagaceae bacterium]
MKKGYVVLLIVFGLIVILMLIPAKRQHSETVTMACPPDAVTRFMVFTQQWKKWWPGQQTGDSIFTYQKKAYQIKTVLLNGFYAVTTDKKSSIEISFVPALNNQTQLTVIATTLLPYNPIKRISQLFQQVHKETARELSNHCQSFFNTPANVYGYKIERTKVSLLNWMSAKQVFTQYPSTEETYQVIDGLKNYIQNQHGEIIGAPIIHVRALDAMQFELMTALPVNEPVTPSEQYTIKQMVPGFMLVGRVNGGNYTVAAAEKSMENYVRDYKKQSPAIPFQTLITDRRKETDTSKWITQLNYPVFN